MGPRGRRGFAGGRPVSYDPSRGRNVVERTSNLIKKRRGPATRYDKHAVIYRRRVVLEAALMWLSTLRDTP